MDLASLWATLKAYQGPLVTVALIFGPGLLRRLSALLAPAPPDAPSPPRSPVLWAVLALHTLYALLSLLQPPYDAFASLDLLTPSDILRPLLLSDLGQPTDGWTPVDPLVDLLLARLGTVEGRIAYSRWGHAAFFNCAWCRQRGDYALAAAPRILGPYVLQAAVAAAAAAEFGVRWYAEMRVVQGHLMHVSFSSVSGTSR
jgi:hypothetical protein